MNNIITIMMNTFKELTRNKIFYVTVLFCLVITMTTLLYHTLTAYEETKLMKDMGLAAMTILGMLIAVFAGSSVVAKEIDKKTAQVLLAKPITKYEFILGKFCGALLTIMCNVALMALGFLILVAIKEKAFYAGIFKAVLLISFELSILTAVAMLFSIVLHSTVASIFTLCVFILGHLAYLLPYFMKKAETIIGKLAGGFLYYILPNLEYFNIKNQVAYNQPIPWSVVGMSMAYGAVYCAAILVLTTLVFRSKELA